MMDRTYTMQDMIEKVLKLADMNLNNRKKEDVLRTNHTAASAEGAVSIFRFLGVEYDFGTYMDDEYEMIGYFFCDGVTLIKNGEINWKAYADAVHDEEHGWGGKQFGITERS